MLFFPHPLRSFCVGAAIIEKAIRAGCTSFLSRIVVLLTWPEIAVFEQVSGLPLFTYCTRDTAKQLMMNQCQGEPALSVDWKHTRGLDVRNGWNELAIFTLLNNDLSNGSDGLGPSRALAELSLTRGELGSSFLTPFDAQFNPVHPIVFFIYDNDQRNPCLSIHNFRAPSASLSRTLFQKTFGHHGYINASWSPNGEFLLVLSEQLCKSSIHLFRYCNANLTISELSEFAQLVPSGSHSSQLWSGASSFIAIPEFKYVEGGKQPWLHILSRKGRRLKIKRLCKRADHDGRSAKHRGYLKALGNGYLSQTSLCWRPPKVFSSEQEEEEPQPQHSVLHFLDRKNTNVLSVTLPGVLLDVAGKNDKAYIFWRERWDLKWNASDPVLDDSLCSFKPYHCILGKPSARDAGGFVRFYLTVVDLARKRVDPRSTTVASLDSDPYQWEKKHYLSTCYHSGLTTAAPKIALTDRLIVLNYDDVPIRGLTGVLHLRHRLNREPLNFSERVVFHPNKNAHLRLGSPLRSPITVYSSKLLISDFEASIQPDSKDSRCKKKRRDRAFLWTLDSSASEDSSSSSSSSSSRN